MSDNQDEDKSDSAAANTRIHTRHQSHTTNKVLSDTTRPTLGVLQKLRAHQKAHTNRISSLHVEEITKTIQD